MKEFNLPDKELEEKGQEYEEYVGYKAKKKGLYTEAFKKWLNGETYVNTDRVVFYVSSDQKEALTSFTKEFKTNLSELSRNSILFFTQAIREFQKFGDRTDVSHVSKMTLFSLKKCLETNFFHNLIDPLSNIKVYTDLLLKEFPDPNSSPESFQKNLKYLGYAKEGLVTLEKKIKRLIEEPIKDLVSDCDVLILEDNVGSARFLSDYFIEHGFKCSIATNTKEAMEILRREDPYLILVDIMLQDDREGGYKFVRNIKKLKDYKDIPIIIATGVPQEQLNRELQDYDIFDFLAKPFDYEDFDKAIQFLKKECAR